MPSKFVDLNPEKFSITLTTWNFNSRASQCSREEKHSGITWYIHVHRNESNDLTVGLGWKTKANSSNLWEGEALVRFNLFKKAPSNYVYTKSFTQPLNIKIKQHEYSCFIKNAELTDEYIDKGRIKLECVVETNIKGLSRERKTNFLEKDKHLSDASFVVGGIVLYVNKAILANASEVFRSMFFGENKLASSDEIIINDVNYTNFIDMLQAIYHGNIEIDHCNVERWLSIAKRFDVPVLTDKCVQSIQSGKYNIEYMFRLADEYSLSDVHSKCLDNIKTLDQLQRIRGSFTFGPKVTESLDQKLIDLTPETLD